MLAISCGGGDPPGRPPVDAADAQPDAADGGTDAQGRPATCVQHPTVCAGAAVHACVGNDPGPVLELCPEACSHGRCTTRACATAELTDATHGCLFYGAQLDNVDRDDGQMLMLLVSNPSSDTSTEVIVEGRDGLSPTWQVLATDVVAPRAGARLRISRSVTEAGITPGGAFRVQSKSPVLVTQIVSDDLERGASSSGGTVLRPVQSLGSSHLALTYPQRSTDQLLMVAGSRTGASTFAVIATRDRTTLSLRLKMATLVAPGAVLEQPPPSYDVMLDEGDVIQLFGAEPGGDFTGTAIESTAPVAVFAGNVYTTYGYTVVGAQGGDMAHEQLPPQASWGKEYVGAWLSPQGGCDSYFGAARGLWTVLASDRDTLVKIKPAPGVFIELTDQSFLLGAGEARTFVARGDPGIGFTNDIRADFHLSADKRVLLAQWLDCEPGVSLGTDARLSAADVSFTLPPAFDHEITLVRRRDSRLSFDGRPLPTERFRSLVGDGRYEIVRIGPSELGACGDLLDRCEHRVSGDAFGLSWRGADVVCSYALTVPPWNPCTLPYATCVE